MVVEGEEEAAVEVQGEEMEASSGRGFIEVGEGESKGSSGRWEGGMPMVTGVTKWGRMKRGEFDTMQSII